MTSGHAPVRAGEVTTPGPAIGRQCRSAWRIRPAGAPWRSAAGSVAVAVGGHSV